MKLAPEKQANTAISQSQEKKSMYIPVSEKNFTAHRHTHNIPREDRPHAWTRYTRMAR